MRTILDYALEYYHKDFSVIPIISKDKKPAIQSWEENKTKRADEKQLREWFLNGGSSYNIAIVTGSISQIVAFDIDGDAAKEHFDRTVKELGDGSIKDIIHNTMSMKTGAGNTNLIISFNAQDFQQNEKIKNVVLWCSSDSKHNEIRLKAEGGYIIVPPSIHPNGNRYELSNGSPPAVLPRKQLETLIAALRNGHKEKCSFSSFGNKVKLYHLNDEAVNDIVSILKPYYKCGERNDFILYLSGWLRKKGVGIEHAKRVIALLSEGDEERLDRIRTLEETYSKENLSEIKGYSGLLLLLTEQLQDEQKAFDTLRRLEKLLLDKDEGEKENTLQLVNKNCLQFFLDQYGSPYVAVRLSDHVETMSINGKRFRNWVCKTKYDATKSLLNSDTLTSVLNVIKGKAEFENNTRNLYLRVAENDKESFVIYYDLTNSKWEVVKITPDGWGIEKSPVLFRRYSNQLMQPYASVQYPSDIFDQFLKLLNVKDEDNKLLLKCYIISLFIPEIPKPILMLHGEQGSAKSTLQELIKLLVDPSIVSTLSFPRDINELIQMLHHNYIAYFDNISVIPGWISNELCRAVTGSGFTKRQLYTDDDDIIYNFKRCIGFNGINLAATKADLLDRGLIVQLERIPEEQRRKVEDVWNDFQRLKPQLLGYIFGTIVKVLRKKREGKRAEIAELISRVMGYPDNKFLEVYFTNIGLQTELAIEANPVATAVIEFMYSRTQWVGTATELLEELEQIADSLKIKTKNSRSWPTAPNRLSRKLYEVKTNLRRIGIIIDKFTDSKTNTKRIEIRKVSYLSPVSPGHDNQARLDIENSGDNNTISPLISPASMPENRAQNSGAGDTYGTGDTICRSHLSFHRLGNSDTWGCRYCKQKGDKWFMQQHICKGQQSR